MRFCLLCARADALLALLVLLRVVLKGILENKDEYKIKENDKNNYEDKIKEE